MTFTIVIKDETDAEYQDRHHRYIGSLACQGVGFDNPVMQYFAWCLTRRGFSVKWASL